nr:uncharacterized protein LOC105325768 isoform X1 [Crassostrea gigas]
MYIPKDKYWVSLKMFELEEQLGQGEWWTSNFNVFESTELPSNLLDSKMNKYGYDDHAVSVQTRSNQILVGIRVNTGVNFKDLRPSSFVLQSFAISHKVFRCKSLETLLSKATLSSVSRAVMKWVMLKDLMKAFENQDFLLCLDSVKKYKKMHKTCIQELTILFKKVKSLSIIKTCNHIDQDSINCLQEGMQLLLNDLRSEKMSPTYVMLHRRDCLHRELLIVLCRLSSFCLSLTNTHFEDRSPFSSDSPVTRNSIMNLFEENLFLRACELPSSNFKEQKTVLTSILKTCDLPSSDFNEQKDVILKADKKPGQLGSSIHHSSFMEITKDVVRFLSNDLAMILFYRTLSILSHCVLRKRNDVVNVSIIGTLNNDRPLLCLNAPNGAKKCSARGSTALNNNNRRVREQQIQDQVKIFFMNNTGIMNLEKEDVNGENKTEEKKQMDVENVKSIKDGTHDEINDKDGKDQSENQGLIKVIPEIFRFVEVRTGTDIVVCPATQQQVLEPFLNRFSAPDNKPSKHDTMAMEFLRLCSMHDYPSKQGPSLLRLAEAGFYYEGNGDELICFSCGVRNRNWSYGDSPREIHQRLSPGCKFLTEGGDGNVQVPRDQPTEELASHQTTRILETDGLNVSDGASVREPANNTAHLSSAGYSQLRSESPQPVMAIKHPEYTARSARLGSYQTFPRHMKQHPADMTDAGFYYAGFGDCCRCFHCGIGLRNWDPEDNPWIEHARWSAECPYILKMKGQAFIDLVQEAARAAEMADNDGDNEADNESASTQSKSAANEKSGANNSEPNSTAGNSSYEIENNVAKASEAEISKGTPEDGGSSAGNTIEAKPIKAPLRTAAAQSLIHDEHIIPKFVTAAIDELVKTEGWGAFSLENIRKYLKSQEASRKSATSASNADPSMLKQENKELKDLTICKICLDEKVSIVFLPCGHLVSCPQCAPALTKCPICRKGIKGTVRTNLVEKNTLKSNTLDKNNPKTNTKKT